MKKQETILVLDFGGQYKELIARRIREMNVFSVIMPSTTPIKKIKELHPIGIIFTGGPHSVCGENAPACDSAIFDLSIPILGICYGMQFMAHALGGKVQPCKTSEYGVSQIKTKSASKLFQGLLKTESALMSHTDAVTTLPKGFITTSSSKDCAIASMENASKNLYAVQFHPEVIHTKNGKTFLKNFVFLICGATGTYNLKDYLSNQMKQIREKVGNKTVLLGLSGGVDSSVVAALISKAIPNQLVCIYVDHGLMREKESEQIEGYFKNTSLKFVRVNAQKQFLGQLKGVTSPEKKRKIIGREFIEGFQKRSKKTQSL